MHPPFFSSSFGSTAGAEFFVKTAKNGFGSPVWLTGVGALTEALSFSNLFTFHIILYYYNSGFNSGFPIYPSYPFTIESAFLKIFVGEKKSPIITFIKNN